jgi:hypothetical protein
MKRRPASHTTLEMPKFLHELFGKRTTKVELAIVLLCCLVLSALLLVHSYSEWEGLVLWKKMLLVILTLDITGGVVANLTKGTNEYYQASPKARTVFIAIHVQPIILGWLLGNFLLGVTVWVFTIAATLIVVNLKGKGIQRTAGLALAITGICFLIVRTEPHFALTALLAFYVFKLVFSFAVDHG